MIYQYTTPVFGFEYGGGGLASPNPGGADGDIRVNILIYDIGGNAGYGSTVGYFWSKDYYPQASLNDQKTNLSEIFYIDSYFSDRSADRVASALIHEFVHMANFNKKYVKHGKAHSTWYTEMLAMLAEDLIGPMIGINPDNPAHPIQERIPYWLGLYSYDPTFWAGSMSYGITYGFGAYIVRNYGGPTLVREIALNDSVNIDSLSAAITALNPHGNFAKAIERYYEVFFCRDTQYCGMNSFNRTVSNIIDGDIYTFHGFDIWNMSRVNIAIGVGWLSYWRTELQGPFIYPLNQPFFLDWYSPILLSCSDWQNISGELTLEVVKPSYTGVDMYIIVK
jgi:hypothetical protein